MAEETFGNGRYRVERMLGQGGAGRVYLATDTELDRKVAIKVQLPGSDPDAVVRFRREATAIAKLRHPNIVGIFDIGIQDDAVYFVQEFLEGSPLDLLIRDQALPLVAALRVLFDVATALAYAHKQGIVHRDIKPSNVFVHPDGHAKILDFGVARLEETSAITATGSFVGTLLYVSPEQLMGKAIDHRSDIYSFGATAFQTLTGRSLFGGELANLINQVIHEVPRRISSFGEFFPPGLDDLVWRCVQKNPEDRPQQMTEVVETLKQEEAKLTHPQGEATVVAKAPTAISEEERRDALRREANRRSEEFQRQAQFRQRQREESRRERAEAQRAEAERQAKESERRVPAADVISGTVVGPLIPPDAPFQKDRVVKRTGREALVPGSKIRRFVINELVAEGQTGNLYKAFDPVRSRLVGLKVIPNPTSVDVARLMRASRIWLDLRHERLQTILEVDPGEKSEPALVVTELIEGVDLGRLMSSRELSVIQKIEIVLQVCDALEFIHQRGIVHREVKPKNIVVSGDDLQVKLLDSGLARSTESNETLLTRAGVIVGDLQYMAPEQAQGRPEQRSDIYSLGAVVYQLMFNARFDGIHGGQLLEKLGTAPFIPTRLGEAMYKALHPDLNHRFASAREFADSLRSLVPEKLVPQKLANTVVTLHGIRTHASWQRAFAEVGSRAGFNCRLDRWNFGYFTIFKFLMPWSRQAKLNWFRGTYHDEFGERATSALSDEHPSIVAHSFGTYILGNALLRYPYLRFNKVILCGSILPEGFPWDVLIDRGQVQAVRNEYGSRDIWSHVAPWMVPGTGRSGVTGFTNQHSRLDQERFDFSHSEYFERGHMEERWLPFLRRKFSYITLRERVAEPQPASMPIGLKILYGTTLIALALIVSRFF